MNSAKYLIMEPFVIFLLAMEPYTKKLKCLVISNDDKMPQDRKIIKILVAIDGSENSMRAVDYAIKLALGLKADVIALHVTPTGRDHPEEYVAKILKQEKDYLDKIAKKFVTSEINLDMEVIRGELAVVDQITDYAEKNDIDLIVIGIRSVSEFRYMLGSTASGVVVNAPCPVLVVK